MKGKTVLILFVVGVVLLVGYFEGGNAIGVEEVIIQKHTLEKIDISSIPPDTTEALYIAFYFYDKNENGVIEKSQWQWKEQWHEFRERLSPRVWQWDFWKGVQIQIWDRDFRKYIIPQLLEEEGYDQRFDLDSDGKITPQEAWEYFLDNSTSLSRKSVAFVVKKLLEDIREGEGATAEISMRILKELRPTLIEIAVEKGAWYGPRTLAVEALIEMGDSQAIRDIFEHNDSDIWIKNKVRKRFEELSSSGEEAGQDDADRLQVSGEEIVDVEVLPPDNNENLSMPVTEVEEVVIQKQSSEEIDIQSIPSDTTKVLYDALYFYDKNQNGVIERRQWQWWEFWLHISPQIRQGVFWKRVPSQIWDRDFWKYIVPQLLQEEGYDKRFDLNSDEVITPQEAWEYFLDNSTSLPEQSVVFAVKKLLEDIREDEGLTPGTSERILKELRPGLIKIAIEKRGWIEKGGFKYNYKNSVPGVIAVEALIELGDSQALTEIFEHGVSDPRVVKTMMEGYRKIELSSSREEAEQDGADRLPEDKE